MPFIACIFLVQICSAFSPKSIQELHSAVNDCISRDEQGDCSKSTEFGPIGEWDVSSVTETKYTFAGKASFNADISNWDVERVTDMSKMFHGATAFDADISKWKVSRTTNMQWMFYDATFFNADISNWNVARVTDTKNMFGGAASFDADISKWNVARVTNMELMFSRALYFNADISKWNVSRVTDMRNMFGAAISFNADISSWNVAQVTRMSYMFYDAASFDADISKWNVARVTHMSFMFSGAVSFNVDISKWDVARVVDMSNMFNGATSFKQTLCPWVYSSAHKYDMFYGSPGAICATTACPKCGMNRLGELSCCFRGGAWFKNCGIDLSDPKTEHTWFMGAQACDNVVTTDSTTTALTACPKCGRTNDGQLNCCGVGGSWRGQCGMVGDTRFPHTWSDGEKYCSPDIPPKPISSIDGAPAATCPKCSTTESGKPSCCARGGSWFKNCGEPGDSNFEHTWFEGRQACKLSTEYITTASGRGDGEQTSEVTPESITTAGRVCPKCGIKKDSGRPSCCVPGGSWFQKCGNAGDSNFEHTWLEGIEACEPGTKASSMTTESIATTSSHVATTTTAGSQTSSVTSEPITTAVGRVCPKCGIKKDSGRPSCCVPGGSWFKKCGNAGDSNFEHTWLEGIEACEPGAQTSEVTPESITTAVVRVCPKCGTNARSGKLSCCAPDGAWFQKCGDSGDPNFEHTWIDGIKACIDFDGESSRKAHGLVVPLQTQNSDKKSTNIRKSSAPAQQYFGYSNVYTRVSDTDSNKKLAKVVGFTILLVTILHAET